MDKPAHIDRLFENEDEFLDEPNKELFNIDNNNLGGHSRKRRRLSN